ncbi:hypothetical protein F5880DRAFT_1615163 [Lentinula raphanica]|nr:hypothetical protein F5880DRAFT_1615163 [Lentinula raphanica]
MNPSNILHPRLVPYFHNIHVQDERPAMLLTLWLGERKVRIFLDSHEDIPDNEKKQVIFGRIPEGKRESSQTPRKPNYSQLMPSTKMEAYSYFDSRNKQLQELSRQLSCVGRMRNDFLTQCHDNLPSDNLALIVLRNLDMLLIAIQSKKTSFEVTWWRLLDERPLEVENLLTVLMNEFRNRPAGFWQALPNISYRDFSTLGVGRWLNDEVINFFIDKWCFKSRDTLGFGTFFAGSCLFDDKYSCLIAKRFFTEEDEYRVRRFVMRRQKSLDLDYWDSVFIPIHEGSSHWYSARIDFVLKRIDVYDSLQETCVTNRQKPVSLRKNTNLMLVRPNLICYLTRF